LSVFGEDGDEKELKANGSYWKIKTLWQRWKTVN